MRPVLWFEKLTGFAEGSRADVLSKLSFQDGKIRTNGGQQVWNVGTFRQPTLQSLREELDAVNNQDTCSKRRIRLSSWVGDVRELHQHPGAIIQAASQFNLLEMPSPNVTPEAGIANYEHDHTQGPACAVMGGVGTIYRQYFLEGGQTAEHQVNCLQRVQDLLAKNMGVESVLTMKNGYALLDVAQAQAMDDYLGKASETQLDELQGKLEIGIMEDTPVESHVVTQAYCSALPVGYCSAPKESLERFARLVLEASYEILLLYAALQSIKEPTTLYLTLLGGGVFQNDVEWIADAIDRSLSQVEGYEVEVILNFYSPRNEKCLKDLLVKWK